MYEIEKGITPPNGFEYPLEQMEVGDSFLLPEHDGIKGERERLLVLAKNRYGNWRRYTTKFVDGGVRVWRVK